MRRLLGWSFSPKGYAGTDNSPVPPELETPLQEGGEVLRPDFVVRERGPRDDGSRWQLVVKAIKPSDALDRVAGAPAASRCRPTAGWSGCCGRSGCRRGCC